MATIIMSIGIPGSGKTSVLKKIAQWGSFECFGPDSIRMEKHQDEADHSDDKAIWIHLRSQVVDAMKNGKDVIIDSTFHTAKRRAHFIEFARANGATVIEGLYFEIPLEMNLSRSIGRETSGGKAVSTDYIKKAYVEFQENLPRPEEGFDVLYKIDQDNNVIVIKSKPDSILSAYFNK